MQKKEIQSKAYRIFINENDEEIGHVYLYVIQNDLHDKPYGLIEDLFVYEKYRKKGYGKKLISDVVKLAKELNCYKLIAQSRYGREGIHELYEKIGFKDHGKNFRIDLFESNRKQVD